MAEAFLTGQSGKKLVGNAVVGNVLSGKTFSNANSNKLTGTMPNRGKVDYQMPINGSFTIPAGYHDGTGSIFQSITTKGSETFTPGTANQTVASGRYLTGTQTILGDANLVAGNIKNGVSIFGVIGSAAIPGGTAGAAQILAGYTFINSAGVEVTGTIPSKAAATYTPGTSNQTIAIGQYISGTQTITGDADLVTGNIKAGANIFGVAGKASVVDTADATAAAARILSGYTGYVNGAKITGTIASKAAATYTPGTSTQTIAAGYYLSGTQTISAVAGLSAGNIKTGVKVGGVTGTYKGVGTATAARVLTGYTFSTAALSGASGTMVNRGAITKSLTTQGASYTVPVGYHSGSGKVTASFSNLSAGNVKKGVNIGGVVGSVVSATVCSGIINPTTIFDVNTSTREVVISLNLGFTPSRIFLFDSYGSTMEYGRFYCTTPVVIRRTGNSGMGYRVYEDDFLTSKEGHVTTFSMVEGGFSFVSSSSGSYPKLKFKNDIYWMATP